MTDKIITIDGPSASGKGYISRTLSNILGFKYLESGIYYRALACMANSGYNKDLLLDYASNLVIERDNIGNIYANNIDITNIVYSDTISLLSSKLAKNLELRLALLQVQRNSYNPNIGLVADGRDMGSVVFPYAGLKIFLNANVLTRTYRRLNQLKKKYVNVKIIDVQNSLILRDISDMHREYSKLSYSGNHYFNSNNVGTDELIEIILNLSGNFY